MLGSFPSSVFDFSFPISHFPFFILFPFFPCSLFPFSSFPGSAVLLFHWFPSSPIPPSPFTLFGMTDSAQRFTTRVESYVKYRPGYPAELLEVLRQECGLTIDAVVADVGSGTGILSELLLKNGNTVYGVEPNAAMRTAGEHLLQSYRKFKSVDGSAENTTLPAGSMDLITAGQAFHWFDGTAARKEFVRILKPQGVVALVWNDRRLDATPFLRAYEELLLNFGTDYSQISELYGEGPVAEFFAPRKFKVGSFENVQQFDFSGLKGRLLSASYTPEPGHPKFESMLERLQEIFDRYQERGKVAFEYDTKVFYGPLE